MALKACVPFLLFWLFLILGSGCAHGLVYNHCPDCTDLCHVECPFDKYGEWCILECPPWQLCHDQEAIVSPCYILIPIWNGTDVPFEGSEEDGGVRRVKSAEVSVTLRSSYRDIDVTVNSWDCNENKFVRLGNVEVRNWKTRTWEVTEYFLSCTDGYNISIEPEPSKYRYLYVSEANLSVDYDLEEMYGQLSASLYTNLPPGNITEKYKSFKATADVGCSGGDCGPVKVFLQYANESDETPIPDFKDIPETETQNIPFYTSSGNPYDCGELKTENPCSYDWPVHVTGVGSYLLRTLAISENKNVERAESGPVPVKVRVGELSLSDVHFYPNPLELGYNTTLHATVSCKDYDCGDIDVYAKNGASKIVPLPGEDDYFVLYDKNPQTKTMTGNSSFEVSWEMTPKNSGEYPNIYVSAHSDEAGVISVEAEPLDNLVVTEPSQVYGSLSLENTNLYPSVIEQGAAATLSGTIVCSDGPCGDVRAHARQAGGDISLSGGPLTTPENPLQPQDCLNMQDGRSCDVSWEITGNEAGVYPDINIKASSDNPEVYNVTSSVFELTVNLPLGDILVSADINPNEVDIGGHAEIHGAASCSSEYCGSLTASVRYSDRSLIGSEGNLSTTNNPFDCGGVPCELYWNVTGSVNDTYLIEVFVLSSEGISNDTMVFMTVQDPENPNPPTLLISTDDHVGSLLGTPFNVEAEVFCTSADCGETSVYLQYKDISQQWQSLTGGTVLNTQENAKTVFLEATGSETFVWLVNSTQGGTFEMRVVAESQFAGTVFEEFMAEITLPGVILIQALSPRDSPKQSFSRGDTMPLKILVTENGEPEPGLSPTASFSGSLYSKIALDSLGDGTYSGSIDIPVTAEGGYIITFEVGDVQKDVSIVVDPSLEVTLNTDRRDYNTLDTMLINGTVLKKGIPVEARAVIELNCKGGWKTDICDLNSDPEGFFKYEYMLPDDTPSGACSLKARATDDSENTGSATTEINISKSELDVYTLYFLSPLEGGRVFFSGDAMNVKVKVLFGSIAVENAEVVCADAYGNFNIVLNRSGQGEYSTTIATERNPRDNNRTFRCKARTSDGLRGSGFVNIVVKPEIHIDVIEPKPEKEEIEKGETLHIMLQVSYSDVGYMEDGSVLMAIGNETVRLDYTRNGIYETDYEVTSLGELSFDFLAADNLGNTEICNITITSIVYPRINWPGIAMLLAGILTLGFLVFVLKTKRGRAIARTMIRVTERKSVLEDRIRDLEKERSAIEKAKEEAELEYYQRKITEAEFKKMMENYEQEILKIEAEIQEFRSEMESLE
jgi:hypothetical protein